MDRSAYRLGWYLTLGGLLVVIDTTVSVVAMPRLAEDLDTGIAAIGWVTSAYALALVAVMPTAAWVAERFGTRRAYLGALTLFTAGSLLAGYAWDIGSLIAFRVVQGLGGGLLNPLGMAIALAAVPPGRRGRMMSLAGLPVLLGPLIGPVLGGALLDHASWRWIFWINMPVGVAAVLLGRWVLPATNAQPGARLDLLGLLLLCPGLALAVFGLSVTGDQGGLLTGPVLVPLVAGAALVAAFAWRAGRVPHPLLRLSVLRSPGMAAGAATVALFAAGYFGSFLILPAYVQIVRGDSATLAGTLGIPQAVATGLMLQVATRLVDRVSPRLVVGLGIATAVAGTAARAAVLDADTSYPLLAVLGAVTGLGTGATLMPTMAAASRALSRDDIPAGTTLLTTVSNSAVATGTALIAAALSWLVGRFAPGLGEGGLVAAARLAATDRAAYAADLAQAVRFALAASAVLLALAWLTSRRLPGGRAAPTGGDPPPAEPALSSAGGAAGRPRPPSR
ncbi:drug resistance transporter, EmrB/QacA subfamily [Micromonospora viridifaciens]|uniref:Drug resistance transporter, EmrB/QacA subfamily n=1 Tax=Micromonospora viridifaciens TaxID=1881 RepID=A0A1C4UXS3_MICVI|nr:DHA2 family efflux MFS transporter permease subunit [Micromonospora viridifaciens]SCE76487.1 drug resistance transporter, EmrB/QacA subfamily [Micromonospora viridifaciens]